MKLRYLVCCCLCLPFAAHAGEWQLDVSGHAQGLYGYTDLPKRYQHQGNSSHGVGQGDVSFSASYQADANYSVSLNVDLMGGIDQELQDYNQGRWGEEVYAIADSPYGRVMAGQTYNVDAQFHESAPMVGALSSNADVVDFIVNPNWNRNGKTTKFATLNTTYINTDGVAPKISYISPALYDTMVGFTYVPDAYNRRGLINKFADYGHDDGYIVSLYTAQDLGEWAQMNASFSYARFHDDDNEFSASLQLKRGGWTLGGGWRKTYIDGADQQSEPVSAKLPEFFDGYREGQAWNVGLGYEIGPYQGAVTYFESKAAHQDNRDKIIAFSNQYQINRNAEVYLAAAHVDFDGGSGPNDNNQGYAFVTGVGLNF